MEPDAVPLFCVQHGLADFLPGVVQAAFDGVFRAAELLGDLLHGELGVVEHHHAHPLGLGQAVHQGEDDVPLVGAVHHFLGEEGLVLVGYVIQQSAAVLVLGEGHGAAVLAQDASGLVGGDLEEPALKGIGVLQVGQGLEGRQEGILGSILGVFRGVGNAKGQVVDPFVHGFIEFALGQGVAGLGSADDFCMVHQDSSHSLFWSCFLHFIVS